MWEESTHLLHLPHQTLSLSSFVGRRTVGEDFLAVDRMAYHKLLFPEMSFGLQSVILEKNPDPQPWKKSKTLHVSSDHRSNFLEWDGNFHDPLFQNSLWGTPPN